jgi:hypothetical protein
MNDYRAAGQELQGQVLAAARKGQQRVATTVKNVTAAAQQIRPQLASLPRPTLNLSALPGQTQLREKAPALVAKLPGNLQAKLPTADQLKASADQLKASADQLKASADQLMAGAEGLVGHARTVQRRVVDQMRTAATPLAHQAAARLSQFGAPAAKPAPSARSETTTRVSEVTVARSDKARDGAAKSGKASPRTGATATSKARQTSASRKPSTKPADKTDK